MKQLLFALAAASSLSSCAPPDKAKAPLWAGARDIQIDEKASMGLVKVTSTGTAVAALATPSDTLKVDMLVRALAESGRLVRLQVVPSESGKLYCFGFANEGVKSTAYELLRSIETDPSVTKYQLSSGESCRPRSPAE